MIEENIRCICRMTKEEIMKKFSTLVLSVLLLVSLSACGSKGKELKEDKTMFLITDEGTIDDKSFNQASYEGLVKYAEEIGVTPNYIQPKAQSYESYVESIEEAIKAGAEVVVTPGYYFQEAIYYVQDKYPEVKFILVDAVPMNTEGDAKIADNTVSILFQEEQSGFLAGYAAVMEGFTKLGFMGGGKVDAVRHFGYGYFAGADYAAGQLGKTVEVRHTYLGGFGPSPDYKNLADAWYNDGIEVIFAAAGGAGNSVMAAAEEKEKWVIGVDKDQSGESDAVLTSAMKSLQDPVYEAIKAAKEDKFNGGKEQRFGIDNNGVALPEDLSKFKNFNKEEYDKVVQLLKDDKDGVRTSIPRNETHGAEEAGIVSLFKNLKITIVK